MSKATVVYSRKEIVLLCAQATHPDEAVAKLGVDRLFSVVVEGLSDSFIPRQVALYDRIFTQVIDHCRHLPEGGGLDQLLNEFALHSERAMLARKKRIEKIRRLSKADQKKIKKICVLSRITVGADVAVTGVVLGRLKRIFPGINVVLIGPQKLSEVFGGDPHIRIQPLPYARRGGLLGRLNTWIDLVRVVDEERRGLRSEEILVIDPDSRLTQLGLFPVLKKDIGYYFFQSRTYRKARSGRIGELAANWLDEVFGPDHEKAYPQIFIDKDVLSLGRECAQKLSCSGKRRIVSINFGVGGNEKKRVSHDFEADLVADLVGSGMAVILDKGFGSEVDMMNRIVSRLKSKDISVLESNEGNVHSLAQTNDWGCDVLTWEGGISIFGALIASSDLYIGYDSGFQHIAAAQGIPIVDVFIGAPSSLFIKRWTPYGRKRALLIGADPVKRSHKKPSVTSQQVLEALQKLLPERS